MKIYWNEKQNIWNFDNNLIIIIAGNIWITTCKVTQKKVNSNIWGFQSYTECIVQNYEFISQAKYLV